MYDVWVLLSALDRLDAAIGELDLAVDDRDLAAALALRDRLDARIATAVRAVDAAGLWDAVGATSMTAWTVDRGRMARPRAAVMTRVARLVAQLPMTAGAWADGRLSTGQVETICSFLNDTVVEVFARHEAAIVPVLEPLSVAEVAAAMRAWRAHLDGPDPAPTAPSSLHASRTLAGRARVDGDLDAATGELLLTALRVAMQAAPDTDGEPVRVPAQRRADALGDICRFFLDHQNRGPSRSPAPAPCEPGVRHGPHPRRHRVRHRRRPHRRRPPDRRGHRRAPVVRQPPLPGPRPREVRHRRLRAGHPGRPPPLWNVLLLRDQHCRWKGCDRPGAWCEAHHVIWWEKGGTTDLANLVLLCSRHHHIAHRAGWATQLAPDGTLHVTDPWGVTRTTRPPATGPPLPAAA